MTDNLMWKVTGKIYLTESEAAFLMEKSNGEVLACDFGPGILRLKDDRSPWAVPLLAKLRGLSSSDGLTVFGATAV